MRHLRGNIPCVVDVETTPYEIWQVGCVPLDPSFAKLKEASHFELIIRPEQPERCDRQIMRLSKAEFNRVLDAGDDAVTAAAKFQEYAGRLLKRFCGPGCKILPIGQNWAFDCGKLQMWLGPDVFDDLFHPWYRDPMVVAQFLNDVAFQDVEGVYGNPPFDYANLRYLAERYAVVNMKAHDALQDCMTTAKVYKRMVETCAGEFINCQEGAVLFKWLFEMVSDKCLEESQPPSGT